MCELSQIWQDIVDYCQKLFENSKNSQAIEDVSRKINKVSKKKKTSPKKRN